MKYSEDGLAIYNYPEFVIVNNMGYGGGWSMMGGIGGFGFITFLVILFDLVLLGIWLWKQIKK